MSAEDRIANCPEIQAGTEGMLRDSVLARGRTPVGESELTDELYAELLDAKKKRDERGWENSGLVEVCRRMTPQQKLEAAGRMFWDATRARVDELQREHSGWSGEQVEQELRKVMFAEAMRKET